MFGCIFITCLVLYGAIGGWVTGDIAFKDMVFWVFITLLIATFYKSEVDAHEARKREEARKIEEARKRKERR